MTCIGYSHLGFFFQDMLDTASLYFLTLSGI